MDQPKCCCSPDDDCSGSRGGAPLLLFNLLPSSLVSFRLPRKRLRRRRKPINVRSACREAVQDGVASAVNFHNKALMVGQWLATAHLVLLRKLEICPTLARSTRMRPSLSGRVASLRERRSPNESLYRGQVRAPICSPCCSLRNLLLRLLKVRIESFFFFRFYLTDSSLPAPEPPAQRKRLVLQPRSKPAAGEQDQDQDQDQEATASKSESDNDEEESPGEMTEDQAMTKIAEDLKEFFAVRNLDEAEAYFTALPVVHHFRLVDKLASSAVEQKEADVQLVADFFSLAVSKELVSSSAIEEGLTPTTEIIEDIAIDAPKAYTFLAMIINATGLAEERRRALASKSSASEELLALLS